MSPHIDKIVSKFTSDLIRELYATVRAEVAAVILSGDSFRPKRGPGRPRKDPFATTAPRQARRPKVKAKLRKPIKAKPPAKPRKPIKAKVEAKKPMAKKPTTKLKVPNGTIPSTAKQLEMNL